MKLQANKKQYNRIKNEKASSAVVNLAVIMITILVAVILINALITYNQRFSKTTEIDVIMHKYILVMEAEGYLPDTAKAELTSQLGALGIYDINLAGTTSTEVRYGEYVTLSLSAKTKIKNYNIFSVFDVESEEEEIAVERKLVSTFKY